MSQVSINEMLAGRRENQDMAMGGGIIRAYRMCVRRVPQGECRLLVVFKRQCFYRRLMSGEGRRVYRDSKRSGID